jgi:hypothetical protein
VCSVSCGHDFRQVFGLTGRLLAPASQSPTRPWLGGKSTSALVERSFLLTAAGQFRSSTGIPFQVNLSIHHRSKPDYILHPPGGQPLYVVVSVEIDDIVAKVFVPAITVLEHG